MQGEAEWGNNERGLVKKYIKLNIILPTIILLLPGFCAVCGATKLQENGLQINTSMADGKVSGAKATINAANGGPKIHSLKVAYPAFTILTANVSLNNKKGYYRLELLEKGKVTLSLVAKDGKAVQGSGRISVNKHGEVEYRVTAIKAKGVAYEMAFGSLAAKTAMPDSAVPAAQPKPTTADAIVTPMVKPKPAEKVAEPSNDLALTIACLPGKKCLIRVQNNSKTKAYRNIHFVINYRVMTEADYIQKAKVGIIDDTIFPLTGDEWPLSLVFGEPPKDIRVALVKAEAIEPSPVKKNVTETKNNKVTPLTAVEKSKKDESLTAPASPPATPAAKATTASAMPLPRIIVTNKQLSSLRFFESGAQPIPVEARLYKNEFVAANTRFIYWELNMRNPAPGKRVALDMEMLWKDRDGSVIAKQKLDIIPKPEEENLSLSSSRGDETPGKEWKPGIYTVEFYSDTEKIATSSFKMN
jgi:hypothetical protein